jgi:hypothetical protein
LGAHFLDLRGLLFELRRENLYLFLLLRDRFLQLVNFEIELRLPSIGNGLGRDALSGLRKKSTRVGSISGGRA